MKSEQTPFDPVCAELRPWLPELADGQPLPPEAAHLGAHLAACPACQQELTELRRLFNDLDALPPELPPLELRDNFLAMLEDEKAKLGAASPAGLTMQRGGHQLPVPPAPGKPAASNQQPETRNQKPETHQWLRIAASVALVAMGTVLGLLLHRGGPAAPAGTDLATTTTNTTTAAAPTLSARLAAARQEPATASQRLDLVSKAPLDTEPGDPAVLTLIHTLDTDPNPNVRLAACEALVRLRRDPRVGPALVEALPLQTDPNVQIALIDALVTLREKRAVAELEQLSQQPQALPAVRQQAANGLGQLI